jgi:hypothetical protein
MLLIAFAGVPFGIRENFLGGSSSYKNVPPIWTAKPNDILEKVARAQTTINKRRSA